MLYIRKKWSIALVQLAKLGSHTDTYLVDLDYVGKLPKNGTVHTQERVYKIGIGQFIHCNLSSKYTVWYIYFINSLAYVHYVKQY